MPSIIKSPKHCENTKLEIDLEGSLELGTYGEMKIFVKFFLLFCKTF